MNATTRGVETYEFHEYRTLSGGSISTSTWLIAIAANTILYEMRRHQRAGSRFLKWYTPVDLVVDAVRMLVPLLALVVDEQPVVVVERSTRSLVLRMPVDMHSEEVEQMGQ
jgi:DNA-directed RNA polymerase specialized sigma24 family protein